MLRQPTTKTASTKISTWRASTSNFGTKDLVFGRYFFNQDLSTGYGAGNMDLPHDKYFRNQNVALDWNHTFTPRLINTAVVGFTRVAHHRGTTVSDGWDTFGSMPGTEAAGIPSEFYTTVSGGYNNGGDGTFIQNRQTWQYTDFVSYVRGKHSISFGGDIRKEAVNRIEDYYHRPHLQLQRNLHRSWGKWNLHNRAG